MAGEVDNVVDIVAVGTASLPLARWWRSFLANPEAAGEHLEYLEEARRRLQALPPLPGRVGRAVTAVVAGGGGTPAQSVEAIGLLVALADRVAAPGSPQPIPTGEQATRGRSGAEGRRRLNQQTLPGM